MIGGRRGAASLVGMRSPLTAFAAAAVFFAALAAAGCGGHTSDAAAPVPRAAVGSLPSSSTSHVVVVVMENKELGSVLGSSKAPYTNFLARHYASALNFFGIRHPSLPNYLALVSGSTQGVRSDCTGCQRSAANLVDKLESAGISWKAYMEDMPASCFKGSGHAGYAKKHDPFMYFNDVVSNPARCSKVVPATQLAGDLVRGHLPAFAWVTPNLCHDTHDCSVATGDRYLRQLVPPLLHELGPQGFLVLTWDEGDSDKGCCGGLASGGRIATVVAGPTVLRGARLRMPYNHYSTLRTIEDAFGLPRLGAAASPAITPLGAAFTTRPKFQR